VVAPHDTVGFWSVGSNREGRCGMRRTWIGLAVVLLAVLLVALPGLAAAKGGQGGASFNVYGQIAGDPNDDAKTFSLAIASPDGLAGQTVPVQVTTDTHLKECGGDQIGFGDLEAGDSVRVMGTVDGDTYIATRLIQY